MKKYLFILVASFLMISCGTMNKTRGGLYAKLYEEPPVVLMVMPPINNTTNVDAKDLFYTSISRPLAEAGYYVLSPLLTMDILKEESAYDAEMFIDSSLLMFNNVFGADAIVFSQIDSWVKQGFGIRTDIRYIIKSTTTNEVLFDRRCNLYLDLQQKTTVNSSALTQLIDLTASALATALTDHIVAARKANYYIFKDIPRGKYHSQYMQDKTVSADPTNIRATVK